MPIVCVTDLCFFGALKAGTKAREDTTVPSVQMMAVQMHFALHHEVEMLPSFLRCFPSVDTLVVEVTPLVSPFHWHPSHHHYTS
jgi:hypothetical protein